MCRMRLTTTPVVLTLMILSACSTTRTPAPSEAIADLSGNARVSVAYYDAEQFTIWTAEHKGRSAALGMFGLIGGAIDAGLQTADAKEAGAKFISASQLTDPTLHIEHRFVNAWQRELSLSSLAAPIPFKDDDPSILRKQLGEGYVIDFKTQRWSVDPIMSSGFSYEPITYRAAYSGRARLIRLKDAKVLWEGTCQYDKEDPLTPKLTPADISGNDRGVVVKASIQTLAEACADYLWRQFFARESGPDGPTTTVSEASH